MIVETYWLRMELVLLVKSVACWYLPIPEMGSPRGMLAAKMDLINFMLVD